MFGRLLLGVVFPAKRYRDIFSPSSYAHAPDRTFYNFRAWESVIRRFLKLTNRPIPRFWNWETFGQVVRRLYLHGLFLIPRTSWGMRIGSLIYNAFKSLKPDRPFQYFTAPIGILFSCERINREYKIHSIMYKLHWIYDRKETFFLALFNLGFVCQSSHRSCVSMNFHKLNGL